ncbi:hypothetical protein [Streptomyces sp. NPDC091259]|uniref:hypothetical protein n=1 Tax=Streptomyces sp. NPDC091259 TaxID=3365976 RepID=UPI003817A79D
MRLVLTEEDLRHLPPDPRNRYKVQVDQDGLKVCPADESGQYLERDKLTFLVRAGRVRIKDDRGRPRLPAEEAAPCVVLDSLRSKWDDPLWERAWWFDRNAATCLHQHLDAGTALWRTAGGMFVLMDADGRPTAGETPEGAAERFYGLGQRDGFADPGQLPGDLALMYLLGGLIGQARTAWTPKGETGRAPTKEEAAAQVEGLRGVMDFIKMKVLPDLRSQRREAAWLVQQFHTTQSAAADFMELDKSTWATLLSKPKGK